jgi:hypothetical protein
MLVSNYSVACSISMSSVDSSSPVLTAHSAIEWPVPQPITRGRRAGMGCGSLTSVSEPSPHIPCSFHPQESRRPPGEERWGEEGRGHWSVRDNKQQITTLIPDLYMFGMTMTIGVGKIALTDLVWPGWEKKTQTDLVWPGWEITN